MCSKAFSSSSKLNTHMQGHAGIKPHKCKTCAKTFTDKSNLRMHMSIHTGNHSLYLNLLLRNIENLKFCLGAFMEDAKVFVLGM